RTTTSNQVTEGCEGLVGLPPAAFLVLAKGTRVLGECDDFVVNSEPHRDCCLPRARDHGRHDTSEWPHRGTQRARLVHSVLRQLRSAPVLAAAMAADLKMVHDWSRRVLRQVVTVPRARRCQPRRNLTLTGLFCHQGI